MRTSLLATVTRERRLCCRWSSGWNDDSSNVSHYTMMYKEVISRHSTDMQTYPRDIEYVQSSFLDSYKAGREHIVKALA